MGLRAVLSKHFLTIQGLLDFVSTAKIKPPCVNNSFDDLRDPGDSALIGVPGPLCI